MNDSKKINGGCLCGDVRWQCETDHETDMLHCHCSMCRKQHGTAFGTFMSVKDHQFRWLQGEELLAQYRATEDSGYVRTFCSRCGSSGPSFINGQVRLPAGCLDSDPGVRPQYHVFTGPQHKAPWFEITDALEQHENHSDACALPVVSPPSAPEIPSDTVVGSCLCQTVVFHVTEPFVVAHKCHCTLCRKARATAHVLNGFAPITGLTFLRGEDNLCSYDYPDADAFTQVFCRTCGSIMPEKDDDMVCVSFGALDSDPHIAAGDNIYVAYKASWFEITDGLPCFDEGPPG